MKVYMVRRYVDDKVYRDFAAFATENMAWRFIKRSPYERDLYVQDLVVFKSVEEYEGYASNKNMENTK